MKTYPPGLYTTGNKIDLTSGLEAVYRMEDASGVFADSANGYDVDAYGATTFIQSGKLNRSVLFEAGGEGWGAFNTSNNIHTPRDAHSVSVWFNRLDPDGSGVTVEYGTLNARRHTSASEECYHIIVYNDSATNSNRIEAAYWDSTGGKTEVTYSPGSDIWTSSWNHVVYTRNDDYLNLYLNGSLVSGAIGGDGDMEQTTGNAFFTIGATFEINQTPDACFDGYIDQTAIWSRALNYSEVGALYNSGSGLAFPSW